MRTAGRGPRWTSLWRRPAFSWLRVRPDVDWRVRPAMGRPTARGLPPRRRPPPRYWPPPPPTPDGRDRSVPAATASERLSRLQVFRPDFYADRRPRTALDIVVATPGFQLAAGSAGRGLAGAAGNVLINGARPPAKAAPITQVLAAIPADEVRAVLLVPPGTMGVDLAGYPVLPFLRLERCAGG